MSFANNLDDYVKEYNEGYIAGRLSVIEIIKERAIELQHDLSEENKIKLDILFEIMEEEFHERND